MRGKSGAKYPSSYSLSKGEDVDIVEQRLAQSSIKSSQERFV
jgi:hypothetical protein